MRNRYIVNFNTDQNTDERSVLMMAEDKVAVEKALIAEYYDFEEKLQIISICEANTKRKFELDY
jgi:hypothetical protein|tara:strand:- start:285 stop:476 length:192 start_codon:yes stop_codon:yes gene_type:complete